MAAAVSSRPGVQPSIPKTKWSPVIDNSAAAKRKLENAHFDPEKHLSYKAPEQIISMEDIGYTKDTGVSPVAVSQPFQLFSEEAIHTMRAEILRPEVMESCLYESNLAACQLRGYAAKYAPFTYDVWNNPKTLSILSNIAGVELIPNMNFEIGHINISTKSAEETRAELDSIEREKKGFDDDEGIAGCPYEDDKPIVGWHTDSYPFVCVTMLSDCTNMVGGETALRTADGQVMRVRGPQMGCAVILQGRYITHQALRALGAQERITMVTSFRPKSPFLPDDSVLDTVRGISNLSELYFEFGKYRLEMLEERIRAQLKRMREAYTAGKKTDTKALKSFLEEQETFLSRTNREIVPDEEVIAGTLPQLDIPDVQLPTPPAEENGRAAKKQKVV